MKQMNVSALVKLLLGWPISVIAILYLGKLLLRNGSQLSWSKLTHLQPALLCYGVLAFLGYFFLRAFIWQRILSEYGYNLSYKRTALLWQESELRRYIPGNIWSLLSRVVLFSRHDMKKSQITSGMVVEVELLLLGSALVSLISLPIMLSFGIAKNWHEPVTLICYLGAIVAITLVVWQKRLTKFFHGKRFHNYIASPFSPAVHMQLLLYSVLSFLCYGVGYFLSIEALTPVNPQLAVVLSGCFVLAYVIGYLSFITPSGLGIREGIIVAVLVKYLPLAAATLAALFSRVVLLITEVVFFVLLFIWNRLHAPAITWAESHLRKHSHMAILFIAMFLFCSYFIPATFLRYDNYYTGRFDLGNMAQTVWNTEHGRVFELTDPNGTDDISRLATHADFILAFLAPFYFIWSDPRMLLLIQTVVVAFGAYFVFKLAEKMIGNQHIALIFSLLYLLNPSVERANLYEFHAVTLATTFLLGAFYYLLEKRYDYFLLLALLAGLTKEEVWAIIALMGLYVALFQKKRLLGSGIFIFGVAAAWFLIFYAIPHALGSQHFAFAYYSDFGDKPSAIIKNMIFSPGKTFATAFAPEQLHYLQQIFMPLGFLSLLSPIYLIFALPDLVIDLLSNNAQLHEIYYQYTSTITPFLFIAAIMSVRLIRKLAPQRSLYIVMAYLVVLGINGAYYYGPLPGAKDSNLAMFTNPIPDRQIIDAVIADIPKKYSVAASNNIGSHLSHRQNIYTIPLGIDRADFIAFLNDPTTPQLSGDQEALITQLKKDPRYQLIIKKGTFVVFRKKSIDCQCE